MDIKINLNKYDNSWYKIGKGKFTQILWYYTNLFIIWNPFLPGSTIRRVALKMFGAKIGKNVIIKPRVYIKYPWKLSIGENTWIGERVWIDNLDLVEIGSNVCISQNVYMCTGNHDHKSPYFDLIIKPIKLEDEVWIGANCFVGPGVKVGYQSMVCVSSVITKNLKSKKIYAGIPATSIGVRELEKR